MNFDNGWHTLLIGVYLTQLVEQGHEVVLFNRGNRPAPVEGSARLGDRTDVAGIKEKLSQEHFDTILITMVGN